MSQRLTSREDQLLQVATRLFEARGHHNTSAQGVAVALGLQTVSATRLTLVSRGRRDDDESTKEETLWP